MTHYITLIISICVAITAIIYDIQVPIVWNARRAWPTNDRDIEKQSFNKTILVTGANSGLGYSTVKLLAAAGTADCIIMACRSLQRCQAARSNILNSISNNIELIALELDLASIRSVNQFAHNVQETLATRHGEDQHPPIHILINNAGIMATKYAIAEETDVEMQMQVNHLGHFALTSLLFPNLISATKANQGFHNSTARVVSVSSLMGSLGFSLQFYDLNFFQRRSRINHLSWFRDTVYTIQSFLQYSASKRANLLFTHGLHQRFHEASGGRLQAVVVHPGYTRTSLILSGWEFLPDWFRRWFSRNTFGSMSSDDGALTVLRAALDPQLSSDVYIGPLFITYGRPVILGTSLRSKHHLFWPIYNTSYVDRLWAWSESKIGWEFPAM